MGNIQHNFGLWTGSVIEYNCKILIGKTKEEADKIVSIYHVYFIEEGFHNSEKKFIETIRVIEDVMTMDYDEKRLNVYVTNGLISGYEKIG
jgi:hypothetical protein